jgi:hypothetical protein
MVHNKINKKKLYIINSIANYYLAISILLFLVYFVAPIFGGKLFVKSLVIYASWIGVAILMKVYAKKIYYKKDIKKVEWFFYGAYLSICMFLWFPVYIGLFLSFCVVATLMMSYKKTI